MPKIIYAKTYLRYLGNFYRELMNFHLHLNIYFKNKYLLLLMTFFAEF